MVIPGRSFSTTAYKWGFNGQEKDDEVYGSGNLNTAMFWEYDTRLGRRWNIDPKPIIGISEYVCFADNPIVNMDILGDHLDVANTSKSKSDITSLARKKNQKFINFSDNGDVSKVKIDFGNLSEKKINKILSKDKGIQLIKAPPH